MKKMRNSKRGFTLTEIIIVVAIIVIVSSAAFVGVAVTLNNAERQRDLVKNTHGQDDDGKELFEAEAWAEIDKWTENAAKFLDIDYYKPHGEEQVEGDLNENPDQNNPSGNNPGGNVETDEERRAREEAERQRAEEEARQKAEEEARRKAAEEEEARRKAEEEALNAGGSTTVDYNMSFNSNDGAKTVSVDEKKTIKRISITWKNNENTYTAFTVTYNGGGNGNFYNANNTCGVYGVQTVTTVFEPSSNNELLSGCSGINFKPSQGGSFTIESYTIEYK
jgi:prepilin-type N-terminal cleavage/methylation domain-containing protein